MPVSKRLRQSLRWGRDEERELFDAFLDHKVWTYVETLGDLSRAHGYVIEDDEIVLSDEVLKALRREARDHAGKVVETFNRDLDAFLDRNEDLTREQILDTYQAWADDRQDARAELIAVTESYPAAADATLAFYADNGLSPEFDFGGHAFDDPPACSICQALEAANPHPLERVLAVGTPHINCRQAWHARIEDDDLPDEIILGARPSGIVGGDALANRAGGHEEAVAEIERLSSAAE